MSEKKYKTTKKCKFMINGYLAELAAGSVVSERTHNIKLLKSQGASLVEEIGRAHV